MKKLLFILLFPCIVQGQITINGPGIPTYITSSGSGTVAIDLVYRWTTNFTNDLVDEHTASHIRLDGIAILKLQNGWILAMYNVFNTVFGDQSAAQVGYKYSTDEGETWSSQTLLPMIGLCSAAPSPYQQEDGTIVVLFISKTSFAAGAPRSYIAKITMAADLSSYSGATAVTVNDGTTYMVPAAERIFKMPDGTLLYPYGYLLSGDGNSGNSVYTGRMLKSEDDGDTWVNVGIDVTEGIGDPGDIVVEPGLFLKDDNATLVYYFRTTKGFIKAVDITNFTTWEPGSNYNLMAAPNSQSAIKYIPQIDAYIAVHNRASDGTTGLNARRNMQWSVSTNGETWTIATPLIYTYNSTEYSFEPCIMINEDTKGVMIGFSRYDGSTYSDFYSVIISNQDIFNQLD